MPQRCKVCKSVGKMAWIDLLNRVATNFQSVKKKQLSAVYNKVKYNKMRYGVYLRHFQFLIVIYRASVKYILLVNVFTFLLCMYVVIEFLDNRIAYVQISNYCPKFSTVVIPIYIHNRNVCAFHLLHILTNTWYYKVFFLRDIDRWIALE